MWAAGPFQNILLSSTCQQQLLQQQCHQCPLTSVSGFSESFQVPLLFFLLTRINLWLVSVTWVALQYLARRDHEGIWCWDKLVPTKYTSQNLIMDAGEYIFDDPISEGHMISCDMVLVIKGCINSFLRLQCSSPFSHFCYPVFDKVWLVHHRVQVNTR